LQSGAEQGCPVSEPLVILTTACDIELKPMSWWRNRGVTLKVGCPATEIDVGRREINIANDESVSFSRLGARYEIRAAGVEYARSGSSHPANLPLKQTSSSVPAPVYEYTAFF
jgi:hypothetical protein